MKPADDPQVDYKALVRRAYNRCAAAYDRARQGEARLELALLTARLPDGARILDIGCGAGVPVARTLAAHFAVTGVDISEAMIARARANVPQATFIPADIMAVDLPPEHFDAAVAFYTIFHLPRAEHPALFRRIYRWLKPGGYLMATVAQYDEAGYTEDDFFGETMYWSNFSLETYRELLAAAGFELLAHSVIGDGYGPARDTQREAHPLIFAQKR